MSRFDPQSSTGLYVHLPFCLSRCGYCDFAVVTGKDESQDLYLQCLLNEVSFWAARLEQPLETVYFGGGTPSRFSPDLWPRLLDGITSRFVINPGGEISAEANPESLTTALLSQWISLGVNRVSIGVQTLDDSMLSLLNRRHTSLMARQIIQEIKKSHIPAWSVDLIYGLPGQGLEAWEKDLHAVLDLAPPHISFYNLILHPGLMTTQQAQALLLPDYEEVQSEMFLRAVQLFESSGYEVYELSNAALPGHACHHNQLYWRGGEWIGIGLSASSYLQGRYFSNPTNWEAYLDTWSKGPTSWPVASKEPGLEERVMDLVMLRLRTSLGLDLREVELLSGHGIPESLDKLIRDMRSHGYLKDSGESLRLSPEGWLLHSEITTRIVDCLYGNLGGVKE